MKKIFSKILIAVFVLGVFLAPFSPNITNKNNEIGFKIERNTINADTETVFYFKYTVVISIDTGQTMEYDSMNYSGPTANDHCEPARQAKANATGVQSVSPNCFSKTITVNPGQSAVNLDAQRVQEEEASRPPNFDFGCGFWPGTWHRCIMSWIYYLIFMPFAFLARLAARILDFFVYYSIDESPYQSDFVEMGWIIVRDVANIFFILALLYVAIKTALNLNSSNNKKMIVTIIGIALIVNFSLFATKVIIDSSNMLAHIFYANMEPVGANGEKLPSSYEGEKSITVGLVKNFDPQTMFGKSSIEEDQVGTFAILLLCSIILMGYMIYMFLSVALIFAGRVVMLWILMIFSPIAFASYTLPITIPAFGHKEWWDQLLKNAFLAPIFIFFLYIILSFQRIMQYVTEDNATVGSATISSESFVAYMKVFIPFIFIFILLFKLKALAISLSGDVGKAVSGIGEKIGKGVVGGTIGAMAAGTAMMGRMTIGAGSAAIKAGGSSIAETNAGKFMQKWGALRELRNFSTFNWAKLGKQKDKTDEADKEVQKPELKTTQDAIKSTTKSKETEEHEKLIEGYENRKEEVARNETRESFAERLEEMKPAQEEVKLQKDLSGKGSILGRYASQIGPDGGKIEAVSGAPMANIGNITIAGPVAISGKDVTLNSESLKGGAGGEEKGKGGENKEVKTEGETKTDEAQKPKIATVQSARTLKDNVAEGRFGAKQAYGVADYLSKATFDIRNTKLGKMFKDFTGVDTNIMFGADRGKGGYEGVNERRKAKELAFEKEISRPSGLEIAKLNSLHVDLKNIEQQLSKETNEDEREKLEKLKVVAQSTYDNEKNRLEGIMNTRSLNYANTVASGKGIGGGFGLMSALGIYSPNNLEIANQIISKIPQKLVKEKINVDFSKMSDEKKLELRKMDDLIAAISNKT